MIDLIDWYWEQESFSDLSGTFLELDCGNFGACIEYTGPGLNYTVWVSDNLDVDGAAKVEGVRNLDEAKAIGESLALQWMLDRYYPILEALGLFDDVDT